jgi:hypothetical protein
MVEFGFEWGKVPVKGFTTSGEGTVEDISTSGEGTVDDI